MHELIDNKTRVFRGQCLLTRKEEKFSCNLTKAKRLKETLLSFSFEQMDTSRIRTMVVLNNDPINFINYSRPRIRGYYEKSPKEIKEIWFEWRIRNNTKVEKTRKHYSIISLPIILSKLAGYKSIGFMDYYRESFEKEGIRITIDSDIRYYLPGKGFISNKLLHKEKFCTIKFKTTGNFNLNHLKKGLSPPKSKLKGMLKWINL
jgi:hypothetical protein